MRSFNNRRLYADAFERLDENAVDEVVAFLAKELDQICNWTKEYPELEKELLRMQTSSDGKRVILIGRQLEDPTNMAIFGDDRYPHHPETINARVKEQRRQQKNSLRKRINEHNSSS